MPPKAEAAPEVQVIELHACTQCGCMLNPKCAKCRKDRKRMPRALYVYDQPPAKAVGPCGCIQILCQGPDCDKWFWRTPLKSRQYAHNFCSLGCSARANSAARDRRQLVACDNPKCRRGEGGRPRSFLVEQKELKTRQNSFCCPACWHVFRRLAFIERKRREEARQTLACSGAHRGAPTVHEPDSEGVYRCAEPALGKLCRGTHSGGIKMAAR